MESFFKQAGSRNMKGLYIAGLDTLKQVLNLHQDAHPVQVIKCLLYYCEVSSYYDSIIPLGRNKNWRDVNSALLFCTSVQTKKDTELAIKHYLQVNKVRGVLLRDIFPSDQIECAKELTKLGAELKEKGTIFKYRVINRADKPVLQILKRNSRIYTDYKSTTDEEMDQEDDDPPTETPSMATGGNAQPLSLQFNTVPQGYNLVPSPKQQRLPRKTPKGKSTNSANNSRNNSKNNSRRNSPRRDSPRRSRSPKRTETRNSRMEDDSRMGGRLPAWMGGRFLFGK